MNLGVIGMIISAAGGLLGVVGTIIDQKQMKQTIKEEVAKAVSKKD